MSSKSEQKRRNALEGREISEGVGEIEPNQLIKFQCPRCDELEREIAKESEYSAETHARFEEQNERIAELLEKCAALEAELGQTKNKLDLSQMRNEELKDENTKVCIDFGITTKQLESKLGIATRALDFYAERAWQGTGCNGNGYLRWMSDVGSIARKALAEIEGNASTLKSTT